MKYNGLAVFKLNSAVAHCYRIFDVADGVDLAACARLLRKESRRLTPKREGSEYLQLSNPPLAFDLGERQLGLYSGQRTVKVGARVFHHGALSIMVSVPVEPGTSLEGAIPFMDELYDSQPIDALALEELAALKELFRPALEKPHTWEQHEAYTVLVARSIEGDPPPRDLVKEPALARLLLGETAEAHLSHGEVREVLDHHDSYTERDLVVVEWNAAFLYEPSGSDDLVDLLEIANAQLLELRYYDDVLDRELARAYDVIGQKQGGSLLFSPYRQLSRELMLTVIELSEFIERVENVIKIVGDVYLARVYELALEQLRIHEWTAQVTRKHKLLQQTYALLKGEVDHDRSLTLEIMVVVLILLEIVMALFQVAH